MNLDLNFDGKILEGSAILTIEKVKEDAEQVLLDSRGLNIKAVLDHSNDQKLDFKIYPEDYVGSKLEVRLPMSKDKTVQVRLDYATSPNSTALQWLPPMQTAGKTHPYLFSQCQAIHCRSMVPCQDTPAVKMPYSAEITAPADLTVLMSAVPQGDPQPASNGKRVHKFLQKIPIQSYLIAIAAGNIGNFSDKFQFNIDFPRKIVEFFLGENSWKCCGLDFLAFDNFDFTRKIVKKISMKMLGICTF